MKPAPDGGLSPPDPLGHSGPGDHAVFSAEWLALRAPADTAARAAELELCVRDWLAARLSSPLRHQAEEALRLFDLGSGTGANPQHLAPRLPGPQRWWLLDHDPVLLKQACERCALLRDAEGRFIATTVCRTDLNTLAATHLPSPDLITASALLDLAGPAWLNRLADWCEHHGAAALMTLSVDGHWHISPGDDDDKLVRDAFNAHQMRDKGLGGALGPEAATAFAALLRMRGFQVHIAPSPWRLRADLPAPQALAARLLDGWRDAAIEQCPELGPRFHAWHARRLATLARADWQIDVGHTDLLGLPPARIF